MLDHREIKKTCIRLTTMRLIHTYSLDHGRIKTHV